jgi:hypothetical protein
MTIKITIKNNVAKVAEDIKRKAEAASGSVSFAVLFNASFMKNYSEFDSFEALLEAGGYKVETKADFEAIPEDEFDAFIAKHSHFSSWQEMYKKAGKEYMIKAML